MASGETLVQGEKDGVELAIGDPMGGDFVEGVAKGDGGKRVPLKSDFGAVLGQGGEKDAENAAVAHKLREFWAIIFFFAHPVHIQAVTEGEGLGSGSDVVAQERWIFTPPASFRESGDKS